VGVAYPGQSICELVGLLVPALGQSLP
jgi:hypothetical protein